MKSKIAEKIQKETPQELIDKVVDLTNKKVNLLKELKESLKYQDCKYHLVAHTNDLPLRYSLFKIGSQENLCFGPLERIESYIRLRNIDKKLIYTDI
jgi:hypothetical protein